MRKIDLSIEWCRRSMTGAPVLKRKSFYEAIRFESKPYGFKIEINL